MPRGRQAIDCGLNTPQELGAHYRGYLRHNIRAILFGAAAQGRAPLLIAFALNVLLNIVKNTEPTLLLQIR